MAPVLVEALSVGHGFNGVLEVGGPVDPGADERGLGSHGDHVVVVARVEHALGLGRGGRGGVVGVLGDHDAAHVGKSRGGVGLFRGVGPGAHELNLHGDAGADAPGTQEVSGEAGDDLGEGESAHVPDDGLVGGDGSLVDHLLELHARHDAGQVPALVDVGEGVVGVVQAVSPGGLVGAGDELDFGIVGGYLQHERLEAEGVVDDQVTALLRQLNVGVLAAGVFPDVPLDHPFHIDAAGGQGLGGGLLAPDKVVGVALVVFVADADQAHFDGFAPGGLIAGVGGLLGVGGLVHSGVRLAGIASAGGQTQDHHHRQQQRKKFFHINLPPYRNVSNGWKGTGKRSFPGAFIIQEEEEKFNALFVIFGNLRKESGDTWKPQETGQSRREGKVGTSLDFSLTNPPECGIL